MYRISGKGIKIIGETSYFIYKTDVFSGKTVFQGGSLNSGNCKYDSPLHPLFSITILEFDAPGMVTVPKAG